MPCSWRLPHCGWCGPPTSLKSAQFGRQIDLSTRLRGRPAQRHMSLSTYLPQSLLAIGICVNCACGNIRTEETSVRVDRLAREACPPDARNLECRLEPASGWSIGYRCQFEVSMQPKEYLAWADRSMPCYHSIGSVEGRSVLVHYTEGEQRTADVRASRCRGSRYTCVDLLFSVMPD